MRSLNRICLLGNLGSDAETQYTPSGVPVSKFSIATTHRYKKGEEWVEETDWHRIVLWRQEKVAEYLKKGKQVYIEGRQTNRSYEDKEGVKRYSSEVVADQVILLGGGSNDNESRQPSSAPRGNKPAVSDDDVPF